MELRMRILKVVQKVRSDARPLFLHLARSKRFFLVTSALVFLFLIRWISESVYLQEPENRIVLFQESFSGKKLNLDAPKTEEETKEVKAEVEDVKEALVADEEDEDLEGAEMEEEIVKVPDVEPAKVSGDILTAKTMLE